MKHLSDEKLPHLPGERFFIVRGKGHRGDLCDDLLKTFRRSEWAEAT
ncbi:MAG: hypothetical protein VB857_10920 [Pirellulaceae bacterium]